MRLSLKKRVAIRIWWHLFKRVPDRVVTRGEKERITGFSHWGELDISAIEVEMGPVYEGQTFTYGYKVLLRRVRIEHRPGSPCNIGEWEDNPEILTPLQEAISQLEEEWEGIRYICA